NPKAVLYYLLKDFGFTAWDDIFNLLSSQTGKMIFSPTHRLLKNRRFLILSTNPSKETQNNDILIEGFQDIDFPLGELRFKIVPKFEKTGMNQIFVEKNSIKFPLKLRKWKESDYFYPFGMKGKKKLSRFLKDEKFSLFAKEKIWVLTSEEKVVWVVGHRPDERFRVHSKNSGVLKIRFVPKPEFSH
ncbi:MAG TPA: tRNA lysidine(34) synthetase TilS, partial [Flavobacteriaceae bacterium]|nr:tRNA lysidine(34) synthetase TilS [Flavobacteriaceae bacterium]